MKDCLATRINNFDFLRFSAAALVLLSHSFPLSCGDNRDEPLMRLSGQVTLGNVAVLVFFIVSGFLVTLSYENSRSVWSFMGKRCLRIFPALGVALVFCAFVMGPVITSLPLAEYFSLKATYLFVANNIGLYKGQQNLPGLFEHNPFGSAVNGSLWTLRYEFTCYLIIGLLGILRILTIPVVLLLCFASLAAHLFVYTQITFVNDLFYYFSYFAAGALLYLAREFIPLDWRIACACMAATVASLFLVGSFGAVFLFAGAYLVVFLAFSRRLHMASFGKFGDFSYGLYIYAFPIQQAISHVAGGHWWKNALISFPLVLALAAASWHFVEKGALRLKG